MGQQERLELCRRDLKTLVLDELLEPVDDVEVAVVVDVADVAGVEPALVVDAVGGRVRVVEVSLHHLWSTDPHLAVGIEVEIGASLRIDDPDLGLRQGHTDGACLALAVGRRVGHGARLGQPVALDDLGAYPLRRLLGDLATEGSRSREDEPE